MRNAKLQSSFSLVGTSISPSFKATELLTQSFFFISQCLLHTFAASFGYFYGFLDLSLTEISFIVISISTNKHFKKKLLVFRFNEKVLKYSQLCKHKNKKIVLYQDYYIKQILFHFEITDVSFSVFCLNSHLFLHFVLYFNFRFISHMFRISLDDLDQPLNMICTLQ